jgi:type 1 glutamine amidotransferase
MKMGYRAPFPNVTPLFAFTLCVAACCTATIVESAEPASEDYKYRWRQQEGKVHVLWIGGGHWHDTLETAAILRRVLERTGRFHVTYTEDTDSLRRLDNHDVVCFAAMLDSLAPAEEQALLDTVRKGKPLLAFHAASACFRKPPPAKPNDPVAEHPRFYEMLGGYVERHPPLGPIEVHVCPTGHPVTSGLDGFVIEDELFLFREGPQDNLVLLDTVYEGKRRPLAWTRKWGEGRVLHVALGHGTKAAKNPAFQQLILNGFAWLASD